MGCTGCASCLHNKGKGGGDDALLCLEQPAHLMGGAENLQEGASGADWEGPSAYSTLREACCASVLITSSADVWLQEAWSCNAVRPEARCSVNTEEVTRNVNHLTRDTCWQAYRIARA